MRKHVGKLEHDLWERLRWLFAAATRKRSTFRGTIFVTYFEKPTLSDPNLVLKDMIEFLCGTCGARVVSDEAARVRD